MVWQVLGLTPAAGRIAAREPRVGDSLEMLNELISLRGGHWDSDLYKSILSRVRLITAKRHLLAHGIWGHLKDRDEWHVQLARGSWPKNLRTLVAGSKKVTPEGVPMDLEKLRSATTEISAMIDDLKRLRNSACEPNPPSLETPA